MSNVIAVAPQPGSLAEVDSSCGQVEAWAANCDSIPQIQDAKNRLGAIDEYLARTTKEGRARVAAAMRRLEVRIGELLGPPEPGKRTDLQEPVGRDQQVPEMDRKTKHDFRQMAANPDVVEQTIEASDDDNPASRRKVMTNIKNDTTADELALIARYDDATPDQKSALATELGLSGRRSLQGKIEKLRRKHGAAPPANSPALTGLKITNIRVLAEGGHSSHQIAKKIKISAGRVRELARQHGIEIPADKTLGRSRLVDHNRVIDITITQASVEPSTLEILDYSQLDGDRLPEWISSLKEAIRDLQTIRRDLERELHDRQ